MDIGVSREELAEASELSPEILLEWERLDLAIPKQEAHRLEWAIWAVRNDRVLAESGLPDCEEMARLVETEGPPELISRHMEACETCRARSEYAGKHGPSMPGAVGVMGNVVSFTEALPCPLQSAFYGFLMVLMFSGIPMLILLGMGVVTGDGSKLAEAGALLAVTVSGGGVGGIVHHYSRGLRERSTVGHYLSWIVTMYGYLLGVFGLIGVAVAVRGAEGVDGGTLEMVEMATDPLGWMILGVLGAFFGVVVGREMRDSGSRAPEPSTGPDGEGAGRRRTLARVGKGTLYVIVLAGIAAQIFWGPGGRVTTAEEHAESLPDLRAAVQEDPSDARAQYDLAFALATLDRHEEALEPYGEALRLEPGNPDFHNDYGASLFQIGRLQDALPHFQRAIDLRPDHPFAHRNVGLVLVDQGRREEALAEYERARELDPENPWIHREMGSLYAQLGRMEDAAQALGEAVRTDPSDSWAQATLARALFELKRYDEALAPAERAVELDGGSAYNQWVMGLVLIGLGRETEALGRYQAATRLQADELRYWRDLARLAHMLRRYGLAADAYAELNRLEPAFFEGASEDREMWKEAIAASGSR